MLAYDDDVTTVWPRRRFDGEATLMERGLSPRAAPRRHSRPARPRWPLSLALIASCLALGAAAALLAAQLGLLQRAAPPAAAAPSAPVPATGALSALPAHDGILVSVDQRARGRLPLTVDGLAPGVHEVCFDAGHRFEPRCSRVDIHAGETVDLGRIELALIQGSVTVSVNEPHATVWLRSPEGSAPLAGPWPRAVELPPGDYEIVVAKYGYHSQVRPLHVSAQHAEHAVRFELRPTSWRTVDALEL
jgi:hypothetical protein